jgi:hypothetical protein
MRYVAYCTLYSLKNSTKPYIVWKGSGVAKMESKVLTMGPKNIRRIETKNLVL